MLPLVLAAAMAGQYASSQQTYAAPQQMTYAAAPQAYELVGPGPLDRFLGHVGESLIRHSWPRLRPVRAYQAQPAIVYLVAQQTAPQASYVVQQPPAQQTYGSPQAAYGQGQIQMAAPAPGMSRPGESVPPVPPR
jgi:hypothetical protein